MQGAPRGAFCVCNIEQHVSSRFQRLTAVPISSVQHPCDMEMTECSLDVPRLFELDHWANQSRHVLQTNSGTIMPKTNDAALDAFIAAKTEIDAMLARLAAHSANHFGFSPEEVNWGHVGTLNHYRAKLREITDSAFKEGEHAA